jgi:hypothetical protein
MSVLSTALVCVCTQRERVRLAGKAWADAFARRLLCCAGSQSRRTACGSRALQDLHTERCRICTRFVAHWEGTEGRIAVEAVPGAPWGWCALVMQGSWSCSGARVSCVRCCVYSCLTASVWLADAQAGGSPGEAQGARILRHRREGLRTHGSRGPVGPQGASTHLCPQKAVGQQRKGRLLERAKQSRGGRTTGKREHGKRGLRCAVGCVLAVCWILIGSCCVVSGTRLISTLCCPSSAPRSALPALPPRQHRCPRPATSTRARRLSTTLTTAGPPPRPRAAKLLPGLVCRACLSTGGLGRRPRTDFASPHYGLFSREAAFMAKTFPGL